MNELFLNKITYGDSYDIVKNIEDKSVDLIYVDVPYLYDNGGSGKSDLGNRMFNLKNELSYISSGFDYSILNDFIRVLKKINIYIWCSKLQILDLLSYFNNLNCIFDILFWCKTNPSPTFNNSFLPDVEYCIYFRERGIKLNNEYNLAKKYYISSTNVSDKKLFNHSTIKPFDFVKSHILHSTQENDVVADFFSGSGTTASVCKEINRNFIAVEKNFINYENSCNRLNKLNCNNQYGLFFR